jgi:hypothetical protein
MIVYNPITRPGLMRTTRPWLQIVRSALLVLSTALNVVALLYLQLDQTVSIMFSTPFLVALLAGPMLGEWIGWRRWIAISIGFLGVLVVMRPGVGGIHPAALLTIAGTIIYSIYNITTRILARTDSTETTLFYSNVVGFLGATALLPCDCCDDHDRRLWGFRALSADRGAPARAGADPGALHLHATRLDGDAWLLGIRGFAEPLDDDRRVDCDRVRALSALSRARHEEMTANFRHAGA